MAATAWAPCGSFDACPPANQKYHSRVGRGSDDCTPILLKQFYNKLPLVQFNQPIFDKNCCLKLMLNQVCPTNVSTNRFENDFKLSNI
ncbi:MAG: hypothetical protein IPK75_13780 [Acidobacteria bacterium]|nr:hypothetical protein [Acidobacteriota bacterium]